MSFLALQNQARKPLAEVLPDGRKRLTRYFRVNNTGTIPAELQFTPGTADPWTAGTDGAPTGWTGLLSTYVKMRDSERGFPQGGEDDKPIVECVFEQIAATGETTTGGDDEMQPENGLWKVTKTAVQFSFNAFVPETINVSTAATDAGVTCYLFSQTTDNDGTLINIERIYMSPGTVATDDESLEGGALLLKKITSFHTVPSTPSGYTSVGTPVQNPNGYPIYTYTFAKGTGLAAQYISSRQDGLREVTNIALGSRIAPVGVVIKDDYKQNDGYTIYTVTSMQGATGTSAVTTATQSYQRYVPFTYPGRAKAFVQTVSSQSFLDVYLSPPVSTLVLATVGISYTTTATLTVSDFWNPTDWATMNATWVGAYGVAAARNIAYNGYRTTSATPVTLTSSGYNEAIFGFNIYNGATGVITVTGGPVDPGGSTWTLHAEIEPAFYDANSGAPYFRKTLITSDIPSQAALPV